MTVSLVVGFPLLASLRAPIRRSRGENPAVLAWRSSAALALHRLGRMSRCSHSQLLFITTNTAEVHAVPRRAGVGQPEGVLGDLRRTGVAVLPGWTPPPLLSKI
ncbi:MAG TPA: hypothetical protein VJT72_15970 [Pseudonocardiaceae bacterium]|nr:hypothetical protein [Pseudonocardiaceae bacterium]